MTGFMEYIGDLSDAGLSRRAVRDRTLADEGAVVEELLATTMYPAELIEAVHQRAARYVRGARAARRRAGGLDAFLHEYSLASEEGIVLMCLAEALLRIPDADTADLLIRDKLADADWARHLGHSDSLLVNASTWALMLTGRVVGLDRAGGDVRSILGRLLARSGEPVVREALMQAMRILGHQFVMGRNIGEALERAGADRGAATTHSFDMLGEAALTAADAARYHDAYAEAIVAIGTAQARKPGGPLDRAGISVKLSALHPRYETAQAARAMAELAPRLETLAGLARDRGIGLTIDAEEAHRLDLSLDIVDSVFRRLRYEGLGLAVQAYQKRALPLIGWLAELARDIGCRIPVRLVKGAYWDSEIKRAQTLGLAGYPVFTRKSTTDLSYISCADALLSAPAAFFPQFATHNAHTAAMAIELATGRGGAFEFQRLHGMGEELHAQLAREFPVRVYAPVGSHRDLLPYLVRRLLENGANTSFVGRLSDESAPIADVIADPLARTASLAFAPHPRIPLPRSLFPDGRLNAAGLDLADPAVLERLRTELAAASADGWQAAPLIAGSIRQGRARDVFAPANRTLAIGRVVEGDAADVHAAVLAAKGAFPAWDALGGAGRAEALDRAADMLEEDRAAFMALCVREGGKSLADAVAEVREAVDFCRYYAAQARREFAAPETLPGPTGERNTLALCGRGVVACISPWNFPLAIFTGQVAAALAAGNAVVAKPAEQTPMTAFRAVSILHRAGVPADAVSLVPGNGETVGAALVGHPAVDGVAFTGSVEVAKSIARALGSRDGPIVPLIAETGGQNAMIADSSALAEQVVNDAIVSAFHSAGQRCSALRVLFVQDDVADRILEMLAGAMAELRIGDPALIGTDIGPVIDDDAREKLAAHAVRMAETGRLIARCPLPPDCITGTFFPPQVFEIPSISVLSGEVFGPILHVVRYDDRQLDRVLGEIRATGYGLTLGIHSRIDATVERIVSEMPVGNVYVNRSMIGAVVGVQPFGGEGLSGTGPKAGGPRYLHRFAVERTLTVNTAATGGNTDLLSLGSED
jgi:RHH-type proline utilization regulon transcriptional repressor/proline dehydrogenase/delta 1-pyrroline-5-carboxylate dehydrogenase